MRAPFPFVVGRGRSGTTLLRAMLDTHPELAIPDEAPWVVRLARERSRLAPGGVVDADAFATRLFADRSFRRWKLPEPDVRARLAASSTFSDAVRSVYALYASTHQKPRYGDKTPWAVMHMPLLAELFDEARFVHVIRDGRDVTLSYIEAGFGPPSLEAGALEWRRYVTNGRRAGKQLGPSRYREVRYETLVTSPRSVLEELCPFLGLSFDPNMLRYYERADEVVGSMSHPDARRNVYRPPTAGLRNWRASLSPAQQAVFTALIGPVLEDLGYEPGPPPTPRSRLTALRAHVSWRASRVAARLRARRSATG